MTYHHRQPGNIVVYALSAIAVMSLSATVFATTTYYELKKSSNVEHAVAATYNAESAMENTLYLLNEALDKNLSLNDIQLLLGLQGYAGEDVQCGSGNTPIQYCDKIFIK